MEKTVTVKFGYDSFGYSDPTLIELAKDLSFGYDEVLAFGQFLGRVQNADKLVLEYHEGDLISKSVVDLKDVNRYVDDIILDEQENICTD